MYLDRLREGKVTMKNRHRKVLAPVICAERVTVKDSELDKPIASLDLKSMSDEQLLELIAKASK